MSVSPSRKRTQTLATTLGFSTFLHGNTLNDPTGSSPKEDHSDLLLLEPKTTAKRPPMFRVIMLNDDFTPMDFVVMILKTVFHMPHEDAISTMLQIHHNNSALCGTYTRDVAETKIGIVESVAREHEFPLRCRIEQTS